MSVKALKRQLLAAIAMVLVCAIALGSSTFAWFSAQNTVTAEGMKLKAQAESGIVIKSVENSSSKFATTASAGMTTATALYPTSTYDLVNWYHNNSSEQDNAKANQDKNTYKELVDGTDDLSDYVLTQNFIIRSAASETALTDVKLAVSSITATAATSNSGNLDKSLRVGVRVFTQADDGSGNLEKTYLSGMYIYAPLLGSDFTFTPKYIDSASALTEKSTASASNADVFALTSNTIPANDTGLGVTVYMWFEGEDSNCKSSNITSSIDDISVSLVFSTVAVSKS